MAVIAHVILRGVTPGQYDAVRAKTGWLEQTPDGMAAVGVNVQPEVTFYPAHEVYLPQRAVIAPTAMASGS